MYLDLFLMFSIFIGVLTALIDYFDFDFMMADLDAQYGRSDVSIT